MSMKVNSIMITFKVKVTINLKTEMNIQENSKKDKELDMVNSNSKMEISIRENF